MLLTVKLLSESFLFQEFRFVLRYLKCPANILVTFFQVVEHEEIPALICQQCVKDLNHADLIRKKCLHADEYFRSLNFEKPLELKNNTENRKHDKHESNDEKLELVKYLRNEHVSVDILIEPVRSNKRKARQKITEKVIKHPKLKT